MRCVNGNRHARFLITLNGIKNAENISDPVITSRLHKHAVSNSVPTFQHWIKLLDIDLSSVLPVFFDISHFGR